MAFDFVMIVLGIGLLYTGGEGLVRGAMHLARRLGLSPLVIGLTVVAFATSSPELAASLTASLEGSPAIAIGNILGSNIANVGLIRGAAALIHPIVASRRLVRQEIPQMLFVCALVYPVFSDGLVSRFEGLLLLVFLAVLVFFQVRGGSEPAGAEVPAVDAPWSYPKSLVAVAVGIGLLVAGAHAMVTGAVDVARAFGISERVIGLTLVALGTSLPELASSLVAARRGESDLILGNIVGSNVFNVLCILGCTSLVGPIPVPPGSLGLDFWVMLGFSLLMIPLLSARFPPGRLRGLVFLALYAIYAGMLFAR